MVHEFQPGDYLIFQIESGYGLLRVLAVEDAPDGAVWHLAAYENLFMDVDSADAALANAASELKIAKPHLALTDRAFGGTQVAKMGNSPLTDAEREVLQNWGEDPERIIYDRTVRLLLGLR